MAKSSTENDINAGQVANTNDDSSMNEMETAEDDKIDTTVDGANGNDDVPMEDENDANEEAANNKANDNEENDHHDDDDHGENDDDEASNASEKEEETKNEEDTTSSPNKNDNDDNDGTTTSSSTPSKKRPAKAVASSNNAPTNDNNNDNDDGPLPTLPLKKARTAYFIFAQTKREELKQTYQGEGVAAISKALGELWKGLQQGEKEVYEVQAAQEREKYRKEKQRLIDAGVWPESHSQGGSGGGDNAAGEYDEDAIIFPIGRIRKICKLDGDVKGMSKEATLLVAKATELFASKLGSEVVIMAQMSNRRKLLPDDVVEVCSVKERFMFLKDDLQDLVSEQKEILKEKENEKASSSSSSSANKSDNKSSNAGGGGGGGNTKATSSLLSYFGKVHND